VEHDGRAYHVELPALEVLRCGHCGAVVLDDAANEKISEAFRREAGLLTPGEIRQQREALQLTQKQLARLLQVAEATLSRWETGGQIQQRAMDLLLRLFFASADVRRRLGHASAPNGDPETSVARPGQAIDVG
jgi:putative zinc finger/helix-turn-helix YgiT family protein